MTINHRYHVVCDECGMEMGEQAPTSSAARRLAKHQGWSRRAGADGRLMDLGPICRANERRREVASQ